MFQWHYAIGVFLFGFVAGAATTRSMWFRVLLLVASFTMTFGVDWGFVTAIEAALGYAVGNWILGRKPERSKNSEEAKKPEGAIATINGQKVVISPKRPTGSRAGADPRSNARPNRKP